MPVDPEDAGETEYMTRPLADSREPAADDGDGARTPTTGSKVGAFRLLDRIAQGGMGEVYRAERVEGEFAQHVAVKLIAARLQGADTVRRFRIERQILASLQHPNIVVLLDGGVTPEGHPYIVMEFVEGLPITAYCWKRTPTLEARLQLFRQVCSAVRFAHRHLVVHRDLKPANILVTSEGTVKVLDFGVAKLLEPHEASATATVAFGPMTPNYASPEQIKGLAVTTASDIYALGVVLYELLTEARPYETDRKTMDEIVRLVLEKDPPAPSAIVRAGAPYDRRRLRGELDAIVLKAMSKDTERRYASAEELSDDLGRFLEGRPVMAREPSFAYLARKTIARYRAAFTLAAVFIVLLVAALAGAIWQARVAARERERAVARFNDVRELAGALIFRIHDEVAPLAGSTPVRQTVIAEGLKFLERLERDAAGDAGLQLELARAYLRIGDVQGRDGAANLGNREGSIRSYRKARDLVAPLTNSTLTQEHVVATLVDANMRLAGVLQGDDAAAAAKAALALASEWVAGEPDSTTARESLARAHFQVAMGLEAEASIPHWRESNRLFEAVLAEDPGNPNKMRNVALTEKYLGARFQLMGNLDSALEHYHRAFTLDETLVRASPHDRGAQLDLAIDIGNLCAVRHQRGELEAALASCRQSLELRERLAAGDPKDVFARSRVAFMHSEVANLTLKMGALSSAHTHARLAVDAYAAFTDPPRGLRLQQGRALAVLAAVESRRGRRQAACAAYAEAKHAFAMEDTRGIETYYQSERADVDRAVAACRDR